MRHQADYSPSAIAAPVRDLRLASYNVHKCVGIDGRFDPERILRVIAEIDADVMALQEADSRFGERQGLLDLASLERETGLSPVPVAGSGRAHGWHGNVVLFRDGLVRDVKPLALPGLEPRGALIADLELKCGGALRVVAAHFGLLNHSRRQQARRIVAELRCRDEQPTVLMGDLNEWRLDRRSALTPLARVFGPVLPVPSFPSRLPVLALDRIMADRPGLVEAVEAHDTGLARIASDHLPLKAVLRRDRLPAGREALYGGSGRL